MPQHQHQQQPQFSAQIQTFYNNNNPQVLIKQIPSLQAYPFNIKKVVNFIQFGYTCLVDKRVGKELFNIQVVGGYRMLRIKNEDKQQNDICGRQQKQQQKQIDGNFVVVFILLVEDLKNKLNNINLNNNELKQQEQSQQIHSNQQSSSSQQNILYIPYNIYQRVKQMNFFSQKITSVSNYYQLSQQQLKVEVIRFPIKYRQNLNVQSIDQQLTKITITNLKLYHNNNNNNNNNQQLQTQQLKQLITKIIIHPKFSINNSMNKKSSLLQKQQFQFLMFPQSNNCNKVIVDLQLLDQNTFLKYLNKLSLKMKGKLLKMSKINKNSINNKHLNSQKYYLEFQITPFVSNKQALKNNKLFIAKFVPGKTVIEFQSSSNISNSLNPFIQTLLISEIYHKVFSKLTFFTQLRARLLTQIKSNPNNNNFVCLKSDKSIGIGALLNNLTEIYFDGKRFIKINCQKFATLTQFINRLKQISHEGNTIIFIKNLSWLENLSKNEQVVQDTMKSLIQKIFKTLESSYQSSFCHFTCILYFSHTQIPEQLPKGTKRVVSHLQKQEKLQILNEIFQYFQSKMLLNQSMKETITNMLINSVGWTRIYKFLISIQKTSQKKSLNDKSLATKIQKSFSLENVENVTQVSWSDIGGLQTAKEQIIQTVLLPTKHPEIFDQWIRPRTGLLFYGPPGTGKTLLGKCIAKECKMGFISVKGPQLLNMYVGESEKNVRQVFQRAKQSKPCIVFMDELDALVPKRGNSSDSNSVMDRIVAQLLMQIDMASQNQVFVIGATNRPDLLDPSILRAGRFDKQIYLGISRNKQDRIKILKAQTRNSKLQQNFDYDLIESQVPLNFTGADFYGLTSKSMMQSVQRSIEEYQKGQVSDPQVIITTQDFLSIIPSVKPSVSEQQILHYQSLKQRFSF